MQRRNRKFTPEELAILFPSPKAIASLPPTKPLPVPSDTIIVGLMGGIGNQLFQYAFGISTAKKRGQRVGFTLYRCHRDQFRPMGYQLDMFVDDITLFPRDAEKEPYLMDHDRGAQKNPFTFQPRVYTSPTVGMFLGYWQTEKYFDVPLVREKIKFRYPLSPESLAVAERINKLGKSSAFLHVRQGADYRRSDFHKLLPRSYYDEAVARIKQNYPDAHFFVFGDNLDWMSQTFGGESFTIVKHVGADTNRVHEDMHLMSLCQHGAIANSSFSWWAAWFGDTKSDRMIFAPDTWFGPNEVVDISDLMPDRWTKLGCGS